MKKIHLFSFAGGIVLAGSMWFLRTRPFWDNKAIYSDATYNSMWIATGVAVGIGCLAILFGIKGIVNDLSK